MLSKLSPPTPFLLVVIFVASSVVADAMIACCSRLIQPAKTIRRRCQGCRRKIMDGHFSHSSQSAILLNEERNRSTPGGHDGCGRARKRVVLGQGDADHPVNRRTIRADTNRGEGRGFGLGRDGTVLPERLVEKLRTWQQAMPEFKFGNRNMLGKKRGKR